MCETKVQEKFYFTPETIRPTQSFTGRLLYAGADSNFLNPPNCATITPIDKWIGKPVRVIARIVYLIFLTYIAAVAGVVTHFTASVCYGTAALAGRLNNDPAMKEKYTAYAEEHLKSTGLDLLSCFIIHSAFVDEPTHAPHLWMSRTPVKILSADKQTTYTVPFDDYVHIHFKAREKRATPTEIFRMLHN